MTTMKALARKSQHSKCESGALIYFKHPVDLELREKLSVVGDSDDVLYCMITQLKQCMTTRDIVKHFSTIGIR